MDRRRRSVIVALVIVAALLLSLAGGYLYSRDSRDFTPASEEIHVIYVQGQMVTPYAPTGVGIASSESIAAEIRSSVDSGAGAIVLRVNSPGGTPAAAQELVDAVEYAESEGVPVVTSVGDVGASAAYYTASATDRIVANPDSITGSIGVIWIFENSSAKFRREGTNYTIVKSGEFKDMGYPQVGLSDEEEDYAQEVIDSAYGRFVRQVADGRNMSVERVEEVADGRVYTGARAEELGLVDRLGTLDDAVEEAEDLAGLEDARVKHVNRFSLVRLLLGQDAGRSLERIRGFEYLEPYGKLLSR